MATDHRSGDTVILKVLVSYAYFKNQDLADYQAEAAEAGNRFQFFVDSGAVSAESLGWHINLDSYCEWLRAMKPHVEAYANLDVIRSSDETMDNQMYMEKVGLHPIPVYHRGEPWEILEWMVDHYPYFGIGGAVPDARTSQHEKLGRWLVGVFQRRKQNAIHGFGITTMKLLNGFPFYSVDASSWQVGGQYGTLRVFDRRESRMKTIQQHDGISMLDHIPLIRDYGEDPKKLAGGRDDGYHYNQALRIGFYSFQAYEGWLRRLHGLQELKGAPSGLHLYAATSGLNHVSMLGGLEGQPEWITKFP